ncbi:MAG: Serine/threonine protein kinaserelated protein [Planctomycetaceae bacterium]|nr:Serine/threonine protein kinaserelated protein [Planctomycetaceae bacterium]
MKTSTENTTSETIGCPPADELRQLLSGSLSGDRQEACTTHMDTCTCCQSKLENLATDGTNLSSLVEGLNQSEPVSNSAYWPALQALDAVQQATEQVTFVPKTVRQNRDLSLNFLQPPSDPAYLGRLAHFDVMRVLGRGGMGVVFEAFDSRLQRHVALKVLDPELIEDEVSRQRFCREARAAASITHENVVAVHQVEKSSEDGLPYLVMQLISGESLEQRLTREKKLPLREIVRISMQAAHGLAAAHAQGLIHRDIKPGNILLESLHDSVKLTDFGLARAAEDVKLTRTGFVSGTPLYMAPEQAMGDETDHRSDLFSLGAIMYEMCAGQPPFTGNSALAILKQIADSKHRPLRELNPAIPEWLSRAIDNLLSKKPEDRIQSAAHLAELLEFEWALMKTTSDDVPTVCQIEIKKRKARNRVIAVAIGATFLTLGLIGGIYLANRHGGANLAGTSHSKSSAEPIAVLSANSGAVWAVSINRNNDTVAMGVEDGSIRMWDLATQSVKSNFRAHRGTIWTSQFSPKDNLLATSGDDSLIKIWKPSQAEPVRTFQHHNAVRGLVFSNDGKQLFAGDRDGTLRVWSLDSDKPLAEAHQAGTTVYSVALAPNGETLATGGSDKVVRLWNAKDLTQKLPLEGHTGPIYSLSFNQDGRRLASVGWDKTVRIWDTGSGLLTKSWEGHDGDIWSVAYSPDGKKLATGGTDSAVKVWDAESGALLATYIGHKNGVHAVAFNPDGTLLCSGGRDGAVCVWKLE